MGQLDIFFSDFLIEAAENLCRLDQDIEVLRNNPCDRAAASRLFRAMHVIKGASGVMGFVHLEKITHVAETVIERVYEGTLQLTPEIHSKILRVIEYVRGSLVALEKQRRELDGEDTALIEELRSMIIVLDPHTKSLAEELTNLVSELVVVTKRLDQLSLKHEESPFGTTIEELTRITMALQTTTMRARL